MNSLYFRRSAVICFVAFFSLPARGAELATTEAARLERLANLGRVWGMARYLHPSLAQTNINWDAALIAAIPRASAARDDQEFADAVGAMLETLKDPVTRVVKKETGKNGAVPAGQERQILSWVGDGCLGVFLNHARSEEDFLKPETATALRKELAQTHSVIVDIRGVSWAASALTKISDLLQLSRDVPVPTQRYVAHSGYKRQIPSSSEVYESGFETEPVKTVFSENAPPIAFLFDAQSTLPFVALALQRAGTGWLVAQGPVDEGVVVFRQFVTLAPNFKARIRTAELVLDKRAFQLTTDAVVDADADHGTNGPAFKAALRLIRVSTRSSKPAQANNGAPLPASVVTSDKPYEEMLYPNPEHRLLALFRFWNVIHFFFPYQHLMDEPWDNVLARFIPKFEAARDALEYELACREVSALIPDGHVGSRGPEMPRFFGDANTPVILRRVENSAVVTDFYDKTAADTAGIKLGDVVLTVDGQPAGEAVQKWAKYYTASTLTALDARKLLVLLQGPHGSAVKLTVQGDDNQTREIQLPRNREFYKTPPRRGGEVFRVLSGNIGYVDLDRLPLEDVDPMFERLKETKAIIFDLRGYPQGTVWAIAPRLSARSAPVAASFRWNLVTGKNSADTATFSQQIETTDKPKYTGKTVTLIDGRAQSHAEHTGLFLEAASNTTFIGSPTAGATGEITNCILPGGVRVSFSGQDIRHADGRQLQRIGLAPHIEVKPTIAGIRAGRDEVLERAIAFIQEGK